MNNMFERNKMLGLACPKSYFVQGTKKKGAAPGYLLKLSVTMYRQHALMNRLVPPLVNCYNLRFVDCHMENSAYIQLPANYETSLILPQKNMSVLACPQSDFVEGPPAKNGRHQSSH